MAFADVLDETLAVYSTTEGLAVPPPAATAYTRPVGFFLFSASQPPAIAGPVLKSVAASVTSQPAEFTPRRIRRAAPRMLSPRQQDAFRRLVELGAEIDVDFTPEELRSAYRRLARRYHPDHHPETSEAERQQLARLFAQASDSYAELQDAFAAAA